MALYLKRDTQIMFKMSCFYQKHTIIDYPPLLYTVWQEFIMSLNFAISNALAEIKAST